MFVAIAVLLLRRFSCAVLITRLTVAPPSRLSGVIPVSVSEDPPEGAVES